MYTQTHTQESLLNALYRTTGFICKGVYSHKAKIFQLRKQFCTKTACLTAILPSMHWV